MKHENSPILKQKKILSPKMDVVFQVLFGEEGSEEITRKFLEAILKEKITKVDLSRNPILRRMHFDDKMGILDVIAEIDEKEYCNIEMQMTKEEDIVKRLLYYWSRIYIKNIHRGDEYKSLKRTIAVLIADFELKGLEELTYYSKWKLIEEKDRKIILTDIMEMIIIELPKIYRVSDKKDKLLDWTYFLDNPKSGEVEKIMKENEDIKMANEKLEEISNDEIMQRIAEWREDGIRLEKGRRARAERELKETKEKALKEGHEQGMELGRKEGIEQGIKQGIEQGIKQGLQQGQKDEKLEIARKMKAEGVELDFIIKITELTKEEIEAL